jgi:uncharacterized protein
MINNSQNICIHCGFCCDGTLFNHAYIKEYEPIAKEYLFEIIEEEKRAFKQPCPYFTNSTCAIYAERPYAVCDSFECKLLKGFRTGNISFDSAMKIIVDVFTLKTKIEHQLLEYHPTNKGDSLSAKMKEFNFCFQGIMSEVEYRKKYGELLLNFFVLNTILRNKFKSKPL